MSAGFPFGSGLGPMSDEIAERLRRGAIGIAGAFPQAPEIAWPGASQPAPAPRAGLADPAASARAPYGAVTVPTPPPRPSEGFGEKADLPDAGAKPIIAAPQPGAVPSPPPAAPAMTPGPVATAPTAPKEVGGGDFMKAWQALGESGIGDQGLALAAGLLSAPGTTGWARGFDLMGKAGATKATTDLARTELALKQRKLAQETATLKGNAQYAFNYMKENGRPISEEQATTLGSNTEFMNKLFNRSLPAEELYRTFVDDKGNTWSENSRTGQRTVALKAGDEGFTLGANQTRFDGAGNPVASKGAGRPDGFDVESKLRGEFAKGLGNFQDVHDGYGRVIASTEQRAADPKSISPAADISLIFGYMKMLDPGSVVREGEYATAKNAAGLDTRVRNTYNRLLNGEFLTQEQRQDFIGQAERLYSKAREGAETVAGRYHNLAGQYGVDPERSASLPPRLVAPKVAPPPAPKQGAAGTPSRADLEAEARRRGLVR